MPTPSPFVPQQLVDGLTTFEHGINHGVAPELVLPHQAFDAINTTMRGNFPRPRPYFQKRGFIFQDPAIEAVINAGWFQASAIYKPDTGLESLLASIAGRLYKFVINANNAVVVTDVTGGNAQVTTATQAWIWQSEKWAIWNDGSSKPVFFEESAGTARSNYGTVTRFTNFNTDATTFTIPAVGATVTGVKVNSTANMVVGDIITVSTRGQCSVQNIVDAVTVDLLNISLTPVGLTLVAHGAGNPNLGWQHTTGFQLPPGRMGTYGMGRNWMSLTDGKQFVASDAVGGSSGTQANGYRDAVLNITENLYLAGGGNFAVPGTYGEIHAMRFASTLDASLGQGPLQVFTTYNVFSCNAPPDRTTWQDITNPILTESLISAGATGQDSTQAANGDTIMRSVDGLTSLILARREFDTWGNTLMSLEVDPTFNDDSEDLLPWASAVQFDNRYLVTAGSVLGPHGAYFNKIVPLNFDPVSSLAGKAPSIYDARFWTGLNVYSLLTGRFQGVSRCFVFNYNSNTDALELYEILPDYDGQSNPAIYDNRISPVTFSFESGSLFHEKDIRQLQWKQLFNGELMVDELRGQVDFVVWWKPDQWPCWLPWASWSECAQNANTIDPTNPGYRPRMGFGNVPTNFFDKVNNTNLSEGYQFRVKIQITGHCRFKGCRLFANTAPQPHFAPKAISRICSPEVTIALKSAMSAASNLVDFDGGEP